METSPAVRVTAPGEEHERERALSAVEIRALWSACDAVDEKGRRLVTPLMAAFFRLRLLTAQRGGEVAGMRWDEIDETGEWWMIPVERSKNKKAHRVYLSPQARAILDALPRVGPFVFPSPRPGRPIRSGKRAWAALVEAAQLQDAVPHDLRRTAATGLGSLGVPRLIIKHVLNHVEPGVTRIYDRYSYDAEKRDALTRWGAHMLKLVAGAPAGATVIPIETAGSRA